MTEAILLREDQGGIATLTLNDPSRLNALSDAMLAALSEEFARLATDRKTRVVILRGAGRCFCAGHDLKEMQAGRAAPDKGRAYFSDLFARCAEVMQAIPALPQPVIAQVHGVAVAAGCQLVAACDMAVAASSARFGVNGVNIGLFCSTPMVALTRNVPPKAAFELLTTGRLIEADEAQVLGLVNRIADLEELEVEAIDLARSVAAKLNPAIRIGKRAFYDQMGLTLAEAYAHAGAVMTDNMLLADTDEGISAFLEKRAPHWQE